MLHWRIEGDLYWTLHYPLFVHYVYLYALPLVRLYPTERCLFIGFNSKVVLVRLLAAILLFEQQQIFSVVGYDSIHYLLLNLRN